MSLILAMLLDAFAGEPRWLWGRVTHPVVWMGRLVAFFDKNLNAGTARRSKGVVSVLALLLAGGSIGGLLQALPGVLAEIIVGAVILAQRSLAEHVSAVADALRVSLGDGRRMVGRIVGRDTRTMNESDVARGAIESAAENLSDGVIAPVFWMAIGGLPGLLCYKLVNTADSMIGYRTPRHEEFGWAAARLDDLLNWIPARLTAVLILATYGRWTDWPAVRRDAPRHRSPNAGWPEAAMARRLGVALAGPRSYNGSRQDYAFVNPDGARDIGPDAIESSVRVLWQAWAVALGCGLILVSLR